MGGSIYCLYSTEDGVPKYVGRASDRVSYRFRQHVTCALEKESGAVYDWIRDVWRRDHDVAFYTLQDGVIPADLDLFESYWIGQFEGLLNVRGKHDGTKNSPVAAQIISAIRDQLDLARQPLKGV